MARKRKKAKAASKQAGDESHNKVTGKTSLCIYATEKIQEIDVEADCLHCGKPLNEHATLTTDDKKLIQAANDPKNQTPPAVAKTVGAMQVGDDEPIYDFAGGGDGKIYNLKYKQEIPISKEQKDELENLGNPLGNCCEQKLLRKKFIDDDEEFPTDGEIKMGVAERIKGRPPPKEIKDSRYKPPCGTCDKILISMLCTNKPLAR